MINEKQEQAKAVVDYLNSAELNKLLEYCRRHFPKAFRRTQVHEAESIRQIDKALSNVKNGKPIVLKDVMDTIEQDILHRTLIRFKKQTRAADFLGLREQTLRYKMIRLKIPTIRANQTYYMEHQTEDLNK